MRWNDFLWCLSLSFLAVGLKNFNPGLSIDGPLYAEVSRQIAIGGDWIRLKGAPPYQPFFEHPHLFFWITGFFLKFLPHEDWAVRIPTNIVYFLTHFLILKEMGRSYGRRSALLASLFLLLMGSYANWHANAFLDPYLMLFGLGAIFFALKGRPGWAGFALGSALLAKGTAVLAIGPAFVAALLIGAKSTPFWRPYLRASLSFGGVALVYWLLVAVFADYSEFFVWHYHRHFTNRFAPSWNWWNWTSPVFWGPIFKETLGFVVLLPVAAITKKTRPLGIVLLIWTFTYALMYSAAGRIGGWYTMPFQLVSAIAAGLVAGYWLEKSRSAPTCFDRCARQVPTVALLLVAFVQYTPIRIQYRSVPAHFFEMRQKLQELGCTRARSYVERDAVSKTAPISWYSHVYLSEEELDPSVGCSILDGTREPTGEGAKRFKNSERFGPFELRW